MAFGQNVYAWLYCLVLCSALLSGGCFSIALYSWIIRVAPSNNANLKWSRCSETKTCILGETSAEVPAYAVTISFSLVMFATCIVGLVGVKRRLPGPLLAFVTTTIVCSLLQNVGLAILVYQIVTLLPNGVGFWTTFTIMTVSMMAMSFLITIIAVIVVLVLRVDPNVSFLVCSLTLFF